MTNKVLSVLVYNHSGVLARVSSLFARRGFNIDSLTVSATNDPEISRITISVRGDAQVIDQILSQTFKLEETRTVFCLEEGKSLFRELLLVKVKATETTRSAISEVARIYGGHVVDLSVGIMIVDRHPHQNRRIFERHRRIRHIGNVPHRRYGAGARHAGGAPVQGIKDPNIIIYIKNPKKEGCLK